MVLPDLCSAAIACSQVSIDRRLGLYIAASCLQCGDLDVAARGDRARRILALERIERRPHHVIGVRSAERFGHDVLHAQRFEHRAHRTTGDNAGAGRRGTQEDLAGAVATGDIVMQRASLAQRHAGKPALGGVGRLTDGFRHLACFSVTEPDAAFLVADDDQSGEAEAPTALYDFGDAIDVNELVDKLAVTLVVAPIAWFTRHDASPCFYVPSVVRNSIRLRVPLPPKLSLDRDRGSCPGR